MKEGSKIAIPNNPSNEYRALVLLQSNGQIKLKEGIADYKATPKDITDNPKKLDVLFSSVRLSFQVCPRC